MKSAHSEGLASSFDVFIRMVRHMTVYASIEPNYRLYEQLKRDFSQTVPDATPEQYESAMRAVARATGV